MNNLIQDAQNKIPRKKIFAEIQDLWLPLFLMAEKEYAFVKKSPERYHQPSSRSDLLWMSVKEPECDYVSFRALQYYILARLCWP